MWVGVGGLQSHFIVKPNLVLRLGWGFDNGPKEIFCVQKNLLFFLEEGGGLNQILNARIKANFASQMSK